MDRNEYLSKEKLFEASIKAKQQTTKNFLGDRDTVEALLRFHIATLIENLEDATTEKQRIQEMRIVAKEVGNILLGKEGRKYIPVRKWNKFNGIDVFCAKWLGIAEKDPSDRMEHAFIMLFNEVVDLGMFAGTSGVLDEQWQSSFDTIINKYVDLFMGKDPITSMLIDME